MAVFLASKRKSKSDSSSSSNTYGATDTGYAPGAFGGSPYNPNAPAKKGPECVDCGPLPSPGSDGTTPTVVGPKPVLTPNAMVTANQLPGSDDISVTVSGMANVDRAEVWAVGSNNQTPPQEGWHQWDSGPTPGFHTSIPTRDYGDKAFVVIALELLKDGRYVGTGNRWVSNQGGEVLVPGAYTVVPLRHTQKGATDPSFVGA